MLVLGTIALMTVVFLALTLISLLNGAEASSQQCRDEVLKKHGHLF